MAEMGMRKEKSGFGPRVGIGDGGWNGDISG